MYTKRFISGFTVIELIISLAVIAILASIALPYYTDQINKTRIKSAEADLISLSLAMENYYQRKLTYPTLTDCAYIPPTTSASASWGTGTCASDWTVSNVPWTPSTSDYFGYKITATPTPASGSSTYYTLTASGTLKDLSGNHSCVLTLNNQNLRAATDCPGVTSW